MSNLTSWSRDLTVEVDGHGIVNHAGSAVLRLLADGLGLTGRLSTALRHRDVEPGHDRGRVLTDAAVMIADGGRVLSDLDTLRHQAELFIATWNSLSPDLHHPALKVSTLRGEGPIPNPGGNHPSDRGPDAHPGATAGRTRYPTALTTASRRPPNTALAAGSAHTIYP